MTRGLRTGIALLLAMALATPARGQSGSAGFSVSLRDVPLVEALSYFSRLTGRAVSFDPQLVDHREAFCAIENAGAEAVLGCILSSAELDYIRLSSGTYVVVPPVQREAARGRLLGQVLDARSGRPLADAHVYLASAEGDIGAVSRGDGQFVLPPLLPGRYILTSSFVGYADWQDTLTVPPGAEAFARIEMASEPVLFSPVVVDGLQRRRPSERLSEDRILLADSLGLGRADAGLPVVSHLTALPGVQINDITADIHIQGGEAGEHQMKLDNVPLYLPRGLSGALGPFSALAIERIVVHKSGFEASRGSHLAGVTELQHALEGTKGLDVQIDPLSVNARVGLTTPQTASRRADFMAAARTSLDGVFQPAWLQNTLNEWGRPDAFLLLAPLNGFPDGSASLFEDLLNVGQNPNPTWSFQDLHAAGRVWTRPLASIHASMYSGAMAFAGALPRGDSARGVLDPVFGESPENLAESVALAVADGYDARTQAGQISYSTVLDARTYVSIQLRTSRHQMRHDYTLLDSLELVIPITDEAVPTPVSEATVLPTRDLSDLSRILEAGLEARVERAYEGHFVTAGLASTHNRGQIRLLLSALADSSLNTVSLNPTEDVLQDRVASTAVSWQHAAFISDRIDLGRSGILDAGLRLTYLPSHETVFAEPRLAIRFDWPLAGGGALAARTATGLYRQYLSQFDVSTYNAGAILPSMRVWLPVDRSLQPAKAYHFAQSLRLDLPSGWMVSLEGYAKWLPQTVSLNYLFIESLADLPTANFTARSLTTQQAFLAEGKTIHAGGSATVGLTRGRVHASATYDYTYARRRSPQLFGNRRTTLPWVAPHRVSAELALTPAPGFVVTTRGRGEWGRSWAFRQAYYDYFGQSSAPPLYPPFDLSTPDAHVLKPYLQLDLGAAYAPSLGQHRVQLRAELLNVLNRRNEVDWRFVFDTDHFRKEARYAYPRNLSIAVRWIW